MILCAMTRKTTSELHRLYDDKIKLKKLFVTYGSQEEFTDEDILSGNFAGIVTEVSVLGFHISIQENTESGKALSHAYKKLGSLLFAELYPDTNHIGVVHEI